MGPWNSMVVKNGRKWGANHAVNKPGIGANPINCRHFRQKWQGTNLMMYSKKCGSLLVLPHQWEQKTFWMGRSWELSLHAWIDFRWSQATRDHSSNSLIWENIEYDTRLWLVVSIMFCFFPETNLIHSVDSKRPCILMMPSIFARPWNLED